MPRPRFCPAPHPSRPSCSGVSLGLDGKIKKTVFWAGVGRSWVDSGREKTASGGAERLEVGFCGDPEWRGLSALVVDNLRWDFGRFLERFESEDFVSDSSGVVECVVRNFADGIDSEDFESERRGVDPDSRCGDESGAEVLDVFGPVGNDVDGGELGEEGFQAGGEHQRECRGLEQDRHDVFGHPCCWFLAVEDFVPFVAVIGDEGH